MNAIHDKERNHTIGGILLVLPLLIYVMNCLFAYCEVKYRIIELSPIPKKVQADDYRKNFLKPVNEIMGLNKMDLYYELNPKENYYYLKGDNSTDDKLYLVYMLNKISYTIIDKYFTLKIFEIILFFQIVSIFISVYGFSFFTFHDKTWVIISYGFGIIIYVASLFPFFLACNMALTRDFL